MKSKMVYKIKQYALLMRLHRPIGSLLLLWPTLWALWIANHGKPNSFILIIFILGVLVMRSAGCVINDIADRHFDPHVARTRNRPLAAGNIKLIEAIILFIFLCLIAFLLVLQLNIFTIKLAFIGLALAILYPFTKRFTYWPQLFLGAAYAWGVPMAFSAQTQQLPTICWLIYTTAILWPVAYDTLYAMVDKPDDIKIGIKSTAILFNNYDKAIVALLQIIILILLCTIGQIANLNFLFDISLIIATVLFIYQQFLIKDRLPEKCFKAFLNNNWFGLVIFLGIVLGIKS
jgi:4-hydroxybenzoate polyprenyltransferase